MAKNWSAAEAVVVINKGEDKAAIQDIGRRFPLFAVAAASGIDGLIEIIGAMPDHMTTRKVESVLKADVEELEDDVEAEEKPAKKADKPAKGKKGKTKKAEVEPDDEDESDEDEEETPKKSKGKKADKKKAKKQPEPEVEADEDEDWDEEEESDDDGFDDMSLAQLKKEAKKQKINAKGMDKDQIIAALRGEEPEEEDEDEEDDWDL